MMEPAVTLSDYGLALECALFTGLCAAWRGRTWPWSTLFYAALATAALAGGTAHGFWPSDGEPVHEALWTTTLLALGAVALAMVGMCRAPRALLLGAAAVAIAYAVAVLLGARAFLVAIVCYLPAAAALLVRFLTLDGGWRARAGAAGVILTFVAAVIQVMNLAPSPSFDHNALYHVVQGVALLGVLAGAHALAERSREATWPC
jgi:hypothetical protein